ncbi:MAG: hypothetical protein ABSF67_03780 [Roseiarcus sp.]|jgi:hypothetical protein
MLAFRPLRAALARIAVFVALSLAPGAALAQTHSDSGGTLVPAVAPLSGCVANGACAGPNSASNPDYVAPATGATMPISAAALPLPSGAATAANQTGGGQETQVVGPSGAAAAVKAASTPAAESDPALVVRNPDVGAPGDTACATDTGSCDVNALLQRLAQRVSSLLTALGSPLQAGGAVNASLTNAGAANPTSTLTLPSATTAYSPGTLIANSATAGSVADPSFSIPVAAGAASIPRLRLSTNDATSTAWGSATVQVDLWVAAPTWTNGDRGAWSPATGAASHLATYTCNLSPEYGDGAYAECAPFPSGIAPLVRLASGQTISWSLEAISGSGVTGASKVFTLAAEVQP